MNSMKESFKYWIQNGVVDSFHIGDFMFRLINLYPSWQSVVYEKQPNFYSNETAEISIAVPQIVTLFSKIYGFFAQYKMNSVEIDDALNVHIRINITLQLWQMSMVFVFFVLITVLFVYRKCHSNNVVYSKVGVDNEAIDEEQKLWI